MRTLLAQVAVVRVAQVQHRHLDRLVAQVAQELRHLWTTVRLLVLAAAAAVLSAAQAVLLEVVAAVLAQTHLRRLRLAR